MASKPMISVGLEKREGGDNGLFVTLVPKGL